MRRHRDDERVSRCPDRVVRVSRRSDRRARRVRTSGPTRSASRARSSTRRTVRSATARRGTAKATPPRTCTRGPATSRPASSRSGRRPTERSRRTRTSSTSSSAACPTRRCPPGPTSPTRRCRISPTSLRPSRRSSPTPRMRRSPFRSRARRAPRRSPSSSGRSSYEETGCVKCHGTLGRGDGPSAPTLKDDWGHPIRPADLAQSWTFRGGSSREDIFRTMSTGLNGTPMPSFSDALKPEQRWAITDFIDSLSGSGGPGYTNLVVAKHVDDPIDLAKGTASFESARVARFPIIGQITEPGREFHPPTTSVTVQAIYDGESIALLVRWHDMSAQKTGKNGPSLPVPREEEEEAAPAPTGGSGGAAGGAGSKGSVFGDEEVAPAPAGQGQTPGAPSRPEPTPLPRRSRRPPASRPSSPTPSQSRFRRRCRPAPASRTSSSAIRRTRWISGSSIWRARRPFSSPGREARTSRRTTPAMSPVSRATTGENGRSSSSGRFARPRAPRSRLESSCPSPSRSGTGSARERGNRRGLSVWYSLYLGPEAVPSVVGPMIKTALFILAIELAVIGWVRWRYASPDGRCSEARR